MNQRKIIRYTIIILLVTATILFLYAYREFSRKQKDLNLLRPDYHICALCIISEFVVKESGSKVKYTNKILEVNGAVKEVSAASPGYYVIALGDSLSASSVRCSMDSLQNTKAAQLKKGEQVNIRGICTGFNKDEILGSDVLLVRCVIVHTNTDKSDK